MSVLINTFEDFEKYCFKVIDGNASFADIELGSFFNYSVRITGDSWSKLIDIRHAELILKVQQSLVFAYSYAHGISNRDARKLLESESVFLIKVDVNEGSSLLDFFTKDFLNEVLKNMTGTQKTIVILAIIAALFTNSTIPSIIDSIKQGNNRTQELTILEQAINQNPKIVEHAEAPARNIIKNMSEEDTVVISDGTTYTHQELKDNYPTQRVRHPSTQHKN